MYAHVLRIYTWKCCMSYPLDNLYNWSPLCIWPRTCYICPCIYKCNVCTWNYKMSTIGNNLKTSTKWKLQGSWKGTIVLTNIRPCAHHGIHQWSHCRLIWNALHLLLNALKLFLHEFQELGIHIKRSSNWACTPPCWSTWAPPQCICFGSWLWCGLHSFSQTPHRSNSATLQDHSSQIHLQALTSTISKCSHCLLRWSDHPHR